MVEATKKAYIENYANFSGKTNRADFWWAVLGVFLLSMVVSIVGGMIFGNQNGTNILSSIWSLVTLIPGLALEVRRLHDIGKSGWWILIGLIPIVGFILLIVWYCQPSKA